MNGTFDRKRTAKKRKGGKSAGRSERINKCANGKEARQTGPHRSLDAKTERSERARASEAREPSGDRRGPRESPPSLFELRRGLAVALRAKAEACQGSETKSPDQNWSGRVDSSHRPLGPESLPSIALFESPEFFCALLVRRNLRNHTFVRQMKRKETQTSRRARKNFSWVCPRLMRQ
jgi:hypothetical protein